MKKKTTLFATDDAFGAMDNNLNPHDDRVYSLSEQLHSGHPLLVADRFAPLLARARL